MSGAWGDAGFGFGGGTDVGGGTSGGWGWLGGLFGGGGSSAANAAGIPAEALATPDPRIQYSEPAGPAIPPGTLPPAQQQQGWLTPQQSQALTRGLQGGAQMMQRAGAAPQAMRPMPGQAIRGNPQMLAAYTQQMQQRRAALLPRVPGLLSQGGRGG